jgi:hypothetical protein
VNFVDPYGLQGWVILLEPPPITTRPLIPPELLQQAPRLAEPRPIVEALVPKEPVGPRLPPNWKPGDTIPETFRPPPNPNGNWHDPISNESLRDHLNHQPPKPPHYDYKDPTGTWWEILRNGVRQPKKLREGLYSPPEKSRAYFSRLV